MAEESQTPGHDRLGDRRLNGAGANYLVGDVGGEGNLQNMSKAPLIELIKSLKLTYSNVESEFQKFSRGNTPEPRFLGRGTWKEAGRDSGERVRRIGIVQTPTGVCLNLALL